MRASQFEIWITVDNENPDMEDIAKARSELETLGIHYEGKIGIGFTRIQWSNFLRNMSRFEARFATGIPANVMGFPVRLIAEKYE
jgi:hypothetical protein